MTQTFLADKDNRYVSWNETRLCGKPSSSFVSKDDRFFSDEGETYSCQFSHKKSRWDSKNDPLSEKDKMRMDKKYLWK